MPSDLGRDRGSRACCVGRMSSAPGSTDHHRAGSIRAHSSSADCRGISACLSEYPDAAAAHRSIRGSGRRARRPRGACRGAGGQQHDRNASWINSLCPVCQSRLLKKRGTPKQPADLAAHDCVIRQDYPTPQNWKFFTERRLRKRSRSRRALR